MSCRCRRATAAGGACSTDALNTLGALATHEVPSGPDGRPAAQWLRLAEAHLYCNQFDEAAQSLDRARQGAAATEEIQRLEARLTDALDRNPILVTALNPVIGYEKGAAIAKKAYAEGRPILEVATKYTELPPAQLKALLDPAELTRGGIKGGTSGGG